MNRKTLRTAEKVAFLRAIEAYQPERERLFDDQVSRELIPGSRKVLSWDAHLSGQHQGIRHHGARGEYSQWVDIYFRQKITEVTDKDDEFVL